MYCSYLKLIYLIPNTINQGILLKITDFSFLLTIYGSTRFTFLGGEGQFLKKTFSYFLLVI